MAVVCDACGKPSGEQDSIYNVSAPSCKFDVCGACAVDMLAGLCRTSPELVRDEVTARGMRWNDRDSSVRTEPAASGDVETMVAQEQDFTKPVGKWAAERKAGEPVLAEMPDLSRFFKDPIERRLNELQRYYDSKMHIVQEIPEGAKPRQKMMYGAKGREQKIELIEQIRNTNEWIARIVLR